MLGRLHLSFNISWPTVTLRPADAIVVRYVVGYGRGDQVPADIRSAILKITAASWENREENVIGQGFTVVVVPDGARDTLFGYKIHYF